MICPECGSEMIASSEPIEESFKGEDLTICGIDHFVCGSCGEVFMGAAESKAYGKALIDQYAEAAGLLGPSRIKALRRRYGLTQTEFERVIGVASPTVSRWERGQSIQSKPVDNLLREMDLHDSVMRDLMDRAGVAPKKTIKVLDLSEQGLAARS